MAMPNDRIARFITLDGVHQVFLLDATEVMNDIVAIRPLSRISFQTMAHMVCVSLLRSNNLKGASQTLSFQIDSITDLKKAIATAKSNGDVKGYVSNPTAKEDVGTSMISCTADLGLKAPYHSSVFVSGESMEDKINSFFSQSDQTTLLYTSTIGEGNGESIRALLYHHLPVEGGEDFSFDLARAKESLLKNPNIDDAALEILGGGKYEKVSEESVRFHCDCSKKRFEELLLTLSDDELLELSNKKESTETTCGWCGKTYSFLPSEIRELRIRRKN